MAVPGDQLPVVGTFARQMLPDGKRLHLQHGPIDLIVEASGEPAQVDQAYQMATQSFDGLLQALVDELADLRLPVDAVSRPINGPVASRMMAATMPYGRSHFVTPMAAVAGSVADHVLSQMWRAGRLDRAYVNNGGDIALALSRGTGFTVAVCANPLPATDGGRLTIRHDDEIGGIATSGWRGRSHSLGIADAVTVLAADAACADVAATLIGNAVNLPASDNRIGRAPAIALAPDSDLGNRLVTVAVEPLDQQGVDDALAGGVRLAHELRERCLIRAAILNLQGEIRTIGADDTGGNTLTLQSLSMTQNEMGRRHAIC